MKFEFPSYKPKPAQTTLSSTNQFAYLVIVQPSNVRNTSKQELNRKMSLYKKAKGVKYAWHGHQIYVRD